LGGFDAVSIIMVRVTSPDFDFGRHHASSHHLALPFYELGGFGQWRNIKNRSRF
jgi:hypothetical protein